MDNVIKLDGGIPIKFWLDDIEVGAREQAINLSKLPFVFKHIAIMPDCHQGYGMPIGGVMATNGVIVPNAVGVDIGCGMCALKTPWTKMSKINEYINAIKRAVPVGFNRHKEMQSDLFMPTGHNGLDLPIVSREYSTARKSIGTLGGGNHFIEIQKDEAGAIWIMIHSGSRNLGKQVADHYNKIAIDLNNRWFSSVPKTHQLAFLPLNTEEGQFYLAEMQYCVDFALANRKLIMDRVCDIINCDPSGIINIAHNYASMENHFNKNVLVHRKGATLAREGMVGIIPGSQGSASYIVRGKGNTQSFMSCSHGAGRVMGRKQAQRELSLENEIKILDDLGVIHSIKNKSDLDEATSAYKDINKVMDNQKDLVDILVRLTPIAVIKG